MGAVIHRHAILFFLVALLALAAACGGTPPEASESPEPRNPGVEEPEPSPEPEVPYSETPEGRSDAAEVAAIDDELGLLAN